MSEIATQERTLYALTDDISAYFESREMILAQLAEPQDDEGAMLKAQLAEVDAQLARLGTELGTKTDSIAGVLRRMGTEQAALKAEQERIHARRKTFERAEKWLRDYTVSVMLERGIRQLKTDTNTLFLRGSDACVITDPAEVPDKYKTAAVKLPLPLWRLIVGVIKGHATEDVAASVDALRHEETIGLAEIKKAIKAGGTVAGADVEFHDSLVCR